MQFSRAGLLIAAVLCSLLLTHLTITPPLIPTDWAQLDTNGIYIPQPVDYPWPSYAVQVALWLAMVLALLASSRTFGGCAQPSAISNKRNTRIDGQKNRQGSHVLLLALIILVGFGLRLFTLTSLPLIVDEVGFAAHASDILHGQYVPIFAPGHNANPSTYSWLEAEAMGLFGQNTFGIRLLPLLCGTLSIPATYLLGREWWSRRVGLLAAAFLATYPAHIFYSRMSLYNIVDPFFAILALTFLGRAFRIRSLCDEKSESSSPRYFVLAGIMAGIAQYFYHGSRLVLVLMAAFVGLALIRHVPPADEHDATRRFNFFSRFLANLASWRFCLLWMLLALTLVSLPRFAPMLVNQLPVTGNEQAMRLPRDLGVNTLRAILAWVSQRDVSPFWLSDAPLLEWPALVAFTLGVVISLRRWRDPRHGPLLLCIILTSIAGGAIWSGAPVYVRYMTAVPVIALLVAIGLSAISHQPAIKDEKARWRTRELIQLAVILAIAAQGIYAALMQPTEARKRIYAIHWEEDALAQEAANLPPGVAAVLMTSTAFGAKYNDSRTLQPMTIAHYVAAYGERRTVIVNSDHGGSLARQLQRITEPYQVLHSPYPG